MSLLVSYSKYPDPIPLDTQQKDYFEDVYRLRNNFQQITGSMVAVSLPAQTNSTAFNDGIKISYIEIPFYTIKTEEKSSEIDKLS